MYIRLAFFCLFVCFDLSECQCRNREHAKTWLKYPPVLRHSMCFSVGLQSPSWLQELPNRRGNFMPWWTQRVTGQRTELHHKVTGGSVSVEQTQASSLSLTPSKKTVNSTVNISKVGNNLISFHHSGVMHFFIEIATFNLSPQQALKHYENISCSSLHTVLLIVKILKITCTVTLSATSVCLRPAFHSWEPYSELFQVFICAW